ncbi:MAG: hypothetical protein K2H72_10215, partial [Muribaculaceae bacterium]|nr:hypothetical protein [Muribaculaceae bacterium]
MTKQIISTLRTVALSATVVLYGGFMPEDASARTVRNARTTKNSQTVMKGPDFAYPQTVAKNASSALETAIAHGDWPAAVEATIQMVTADNLISHDNAMKGIAKIDSIVGIAPTSWSPAFQLIKADIYNSIYSSIRWKANSRKLDIDSVPSDPYEWSREVFADKIHTLCTEILDAY